MKNFDLCYIILLFYQLIVNQKSSKRVSKPTPLNKFSKKAPTTGSLARNGDWENLVLKIQNKSHLQKTPNFLNSKKGKVFFN